MDERQKKIRNFSIIAHIDHGKSTLADRLIEKTGLLTEREMKDQILDNMDLERERGITIKLQTTRLIYKAKDNEEYILNLIDTPGHVDFTYEVSRSLAACEGAILVVDATQGVEAQTLANVYLADEQALEIVPVLNKIDLPSARPDEVKHEIEETIGIIAEDAPLVSAKSGLNVEDVLEQIVEKIPTPSGDEEAPLKALIFDSFYDSYKGAVALVRVFDGKVKKGDKIKMMALDKSFEVAEVGYFSPTMLEASELSAGDVGYITASIKNVKDCRVGDTITDAKKPTGESLPGYKKATSMVYCGIYPADGENYENIREALEKLQLNDAALSFEPETSIALGFGFRCGFLGLLHLEIIQERLEREHDLDIIATSPSVIYRVTKTDGSSLMVQNPSNLPDKTEIEIIEEPIVKSKIIVPSEYIGNVMEMCQNRRGILDHMSYIDEKRAILTYDLPLNEVIYDFFDTLKSKTRGYGSLDYEFKEYIPSDLVKMDILINKEVIDAFSIIVHEIKAVSRGKQICERLKDVIPRQMFVIPIQASIGNNIVARENIKAMRKDVLAKCYGGDISRKKKLLKKQKEGKKKMRQFGNVDIPQNAFLSVLKFDDK
ncbi:MAG: translation elongation factor 4 [Bacillota bacterium]|nr:translation elongation factor 4 [Bacillota bacterium]